MQHAQACSSDSHAMPVQLRTGSLQQGNAPGGGRPAAGCAAAASAGCAALPSVMLSRGAAPSAGGGSAALCCWLTGSSRPTCGSSLAVPVPGRCSLQYARGSGARVVGGWAKGPAPAAGWQEPSQPLLRSHLLLPSAQAGSSTAPRARSSPRSRGERI